MGNDMVSIGQRAPTTEQPWATWAALRRMTTISESLPWPTESLPRPKQQAAEWLDSFDNIRTHTWVFTGDYPLVYHGLAIPVMRTVHFL